MERIFDITTWEALDAAIAALRQYADKKVYYLEGTLGPDELLYLDVRDWSERATHIFIEWAQNGGDYLPAADVFCQFALRDGRRYLSVAAA